MNSQGTAKEQAYRKAPQLPSKAKLPCGKLGGKQGESWTKKNAKRKVRETSEHLYQPRKPKLVSDMVMNLNMVGLRLFFLSWLLNAAHSDRPGQSEDLQTKKAHTDSPTPNNSKQ